MFKPISISGFVVVVECDKIYIYIFNIYKYILSWIAGWEGTWYRVLKNILSLKLKSHTFYLYSYLTKYTFEVELK